MGVKPEIWGPALWGAIHMACLTGTATAEFMNAIADVIPCPSCGTHFSQLLMEFPFPDGGDASTLFQWSVNVHNKVNARIGKPVFTVEQALQRWSGQPASQFNVIILVLFTFLLLFALSKFL
jgi:hypothetical protein